MGVYVPGTGFAQSTYVDQMATALPGALAYASDTRLVDTAIVADSATDGLVAGVGVVLTAITGTSHDGQRPGLNQYAAGVPTASSTVVNFGGVVVRNQQMDTNSNGEACWFPKRTCNVLRSNRVGGRVWGRLVSGTAAVGGKVYWVVADTAKTGKTIGGFAAAAITGDTVELQGVTFQSVADASSAEATVLLEIGEIPVEVPSAS